MEHGIDREGNYISDDDILSDKSIKSGCDAFFSITESNRYVPRAILADLEPTVIGEFMSMLCFGSLKWKQSGYLFPNQAKLSSSAQSKHFDLFKKGDLIQHSMVDFMNLC